MRLFFEATVRSQRGWRNLWTRGAKKVAPGEKTKDLEFERDEGWERKRGEEEGRRNQRRDMRYDRRVILETSLQ